MFSPQDAVQNPTITSLRNPRRRQRTSTTEDSVKQPKTKRQRSALKKDTFLPPGNANEDDAQFASGYPDEEGAVMNGGNNDDGDTAAVVNGDALGGGHDLRSGNDALRELTFRGPKKAEKRGQRGDGLMALVCLIACFVESWMVDSGC